MFRETLLVSHPAVLSIISQESSLLDETKLIKIEKSAAEPAMKPELPKKKKKEDLAHSMQVPLDSPNVTIL